MLNGLLRDCVKGEYTMEFARKYLFACGYNFKPSQIRQMIDQTRSFKGLNSGVDFTGYEPREVLVAYKAVEVAKEVLKVALNKQYLPYCHWK